MIAAECTNIAQNIKYNTAAAAAVAVRECHLQKESPQTDSLEHPPTKTLQVQLFANPWRRTSKLQNTFTQIKATAQIRSKQVCAGHV